MKAPRKTAAQCLDDAKAAGRAAAGTDQTNPYKPATQCWLLFNHERGKAEAELKARLRSVTSVPPLVPSV